MPLRRRNCFWLLFALLLFSTASYAQVPPRNAGIQDGPAQVESLDEKPTEPADAETQPTPTPDAAEETPAATEEDAETAQPIADTPDAPKTLADLPDSPFERQAIDLGRESTADDQGWGGLLSLTLWTGVVLISIVGGLWLLKKYFPQTGFFAQQEAIRILSRRGLSARHTLFLVESGDKILLIGMSPQNIQVLSEFSDPTVKTVIRSQCPSLGGVNKSTFAQNLDKEIQQMSDDGNPEEIGSVLDEIKQIKKTMEGWDA
jgi:flagellar biogenesis protein FliO